MAKLDFRAYELPFKITYRYAKGVYQKRRGLLVRVEIHGHLGWGEAAPALYVKIDGPAYARQAEELAQKLDPADDDFLSQLDELNPDRRLRCGISTAWLSARAAALGMSLARYLGAGKRQPADWVPINGLVGADTVAGALEQATGYLAAGMRTVKIKCFADFARDLDRVGAIRRAFPQARIRLDPNEVWTVESALDHLKRMAPFDIEYVEDALPPDLPLQTYAKLRAASPIKLAWDEPARGPEAIEQFIKAQAADVFILKLQRVGGPDLLNQMIRLSEQNGVQCTVTSAMESAVGTMAALHCASLLPPPIPDCGIGLSHYLAQDLAVPPAIENGRMRVPTAPGLGLAAVSF